MRKRSFWSKATAMLGASAVAAAMMIFAPTAAQAAPWVDQLPRDQWPETVSADALPTVQIGTGVVWNVKVSGNVAYAGGEFSKARPAGAAPGVNEVDRANFLAFDVRTGNLLPFAPSFNGAVKDLAVTPDGTKLVAVGLFTQVNGQRRDRIAVFDLATGNLASLARTPDLNGPATSVDVTNTVAYVGGYFSAVNGEGSARLGAVRLTNGSIVPGFRARFDDANGVRQPTIPDNQVLAVTVSPDGNRVMAAGNFTRSAYRDANGTTAYSVSGGRTGTSQGYGIAMFDSASAAAAISMPAATSVRNAGQDAWIFSLDADTENAYGTGGHWGGSGTIEGSFSIRWADGSLVWVEDCHGDTYDIASIGDKVYTASHKHYCANSGGFPQIDTGGWTYYHSTAWTKAIGGTNTGDVYGYPDHPGKPHPQLLYWFPYTAMGNYTSNDQAVWSVDGNDEYVVYGGEFPSVNGVNQQGLVRYTLRSKAPNKEGPRPAQEQEREAHAAGVSFGAWWAPKVQSPIPGTLRVTFPTVYDRDDTKLTYRVYLDTENQAGLVDQFEIDAPFWDRRTLRSTITGLEGGSNHQVRTVVSDPYGNTFKSDWTAATVSSGQASAYVQSIARDDVQNLWRLGESTGASVDVFGGSDLNLTGRMTREQQGALSGDTNGSIRFNDASNSSQNNGSGFSTTRVDGPNRFSVEAWFKTTTTSGGKIVGFTNTQNNSPGSYDRHIYMNNSGQLVFGVYPGEVRTVKTTGSYRDGNWHHVVGTMDSTGLKLYVDGVLRDQRADTTSAQGYQGYWTVGNSTLSGWPDAPASVQFEGTIDEVATYNSALSAARVSAHYEAATTGSVPNTPPTAAIASPTAQGLQVTFSGTGSDIDGSVVSYAWDFGDGTTGEGQSVSKTYGAAGTYTVTLTVTDDDGATGTATRQVTVAPIPNNPPTASIAAPTVTGLDVAFTGSGEDSDGSVVSYAWDFGDGTTGEGQSVSKTYGEAGTYTVTLTVTDDDGATGTATRQVTVTTNVAATVLAKDDFSRSLTNGWGTADQGGSWTLRGGNNRFSVVDGSGKITLPASQAVTAYADLNSVSSTSTRVDTVFSVDKLVESQYVGLIGRRNGTGNDFYGARLRLQADGGVRLNLMQGTATSLGQLQAPITITPGQKYQLALEATGTTTTSLKAKLWKVGDPEPAWQLERQPSAPTALQTAGAISVFSFGPNVASGPGVVSFDSITAYDPATGTPPGGPIDPEEPENQAPAATIGEPSISGLTVDLTGSGTDPDGTIASYAWDFGDSTTGTGATVSKTYAQAGTYTVTLTVTDNAGATATATRQVTVSETPVTPGSNIVAQDDFDRAVVNGWGNATQGGAWTLRGGNNRFGVGDGVGRMTLPASQALTMYADLPSVSSTNSRVDVTFSVDKLVEGQYVAAVGRQVGSVFYAARVRLQADGGVRLFLLQNDNTIASSLTVTGLTVQPGEKYTVSIEVTGTAPTTAKAKVWKTSDPEPAGWQREATNNLAALQAAGTVGVFSYIPNTPNGPVVLSVDRFAVTDPTVPAA